MTKSTKETFCRVIAVSSLACLCWFVLACGAEEPEVSDAPDYEATVAAALTKVSASQQPNEPTATVEPTETPTAVPPTPTPTVAATPDAPVTTDEEPLAPLTMDDVDAFLSEVSEAERSCLSRALPPERLAAVLQYPELADEEDRSALLGCLEHDTLLRLLLTPVLSATGPISSESSACLRSSYADKDLHTLLATLTTGSAPESAQVAGMVTFMVSLSCLSEEEFQVAAPAMGIAPGEYENFQCVLDTLGGQDALTVLLTPAAEFPAALFEAAFSCQLQMGGPPPG
jgi:hypothetical protein